MFHNFWMKILACDQLPQGRKGVVGKERGDRGLRGGDRGLRGMEGVIYLGAGNFLERMLHQEDLANLAVGCFPSFLFSELSIV